MFHHRLVTLVAIAILSLVPVACLTGILEHFCFSCSELSCAHEVECVADPCNAVATVAVVSNSATNDSSASESALSHPADWPSAACEAAEHPARAAAAWELSTYGPSTTNLPLLC